MIPHEKKVNQRVKQVIGKIDNFKSIPKEKIIICIECDGDGLDEKGIKCSVCNGTGFVKAKITEQK